MRISAASRFFHCPTGSQLLPSAELSGLICSCCSLNKIIINVSERGNQRDRDRERAQARAGHKGKHPKGDGLTPEQRRERDAKALQEKTSRKAAQATGGGINAGGGGGKTNKK